MKLNKVLIGGLIALSALSVSAVVLSGPLHESDTTYYSDASKTTIVGGSHLYCTGKHTSWGSTTSYTTIEILDDCNGNTKGGRCSPLGCSQ